MMRFHKWLTSLLFALLCICALSGGALAAPTTATDTTVRQIDGKYYLYDADTNKVVTGKTGITEYPSGSANKYFFIDTSGQIQAGKLFYSGSRRYYAQSNGVLATGFTTINGKTYYFDPDTLEAATGWKKINDLTCHFSKKGVQHLGLVTIKKKTYYFDPHNYGARVTGWAKINGNWYYFSKTKGIMQTGIFKDSSTGQRYYLNASGIRKTGKIKVGTKYYYFDKSIGKSSQGVFIGGAMSYGWKTIKGKKYYFSSTNGAAVTGWATINGNKYYFTKNKGVMKTGWFKISGKRYYFNSSGVMQTGWITLNGKQYYLGSDGAMRTGTVTIDSTVYSFASTGEMTSKTTISGAYSIKVNRVTNVVTIYRGSTPVKAMLCSVGLNGATPTGTFSLSRKIHWHELFGGVYGQYTCQITGNILFHSVYYYTRYNNHTLATNQYNKLGSAASAGCIRLSCGDAYYIYTNCPNGTKVTIFDGTSANDPLGKPSASSYSIPWSGNYDPTDPNL